MKKIHALTIIGLLAFTPITRAATITVNTADNTNFGAGVTNLVRALTNVNNGDTIAFNIPGAGPHYLQTPVDGYPVLIKDNVTIDGYSQSLSKSNSNPITAANNADIRIVLDSRNGNYRVMAYELFTPENSSPPIDNSSMATERSGYGTSEVAILGIYRATNANIRGLAFLGQATGDPSTYSIAVAHDYGLDTTVKDRLEYNDGSSRGCHINGCWFGIDPTNKTVAGLSPAQSAVAFFRHRDVSGGPRPELPNEGLVVGVKPGSANPRSEFNVMAYHFLTLAGEAVRTRFSGNFLGVLPDGVTPTGIPAQFGGGLEIGRYNDTNAIVLGTDGDGVNDADEGNLFGPLDQGGVVFAFYSTSDKPYIVAGNRFGVDINGSLWATNSQTIWDDIGSTTKVQFGSDLDGVSDAWEANLIYNNNPFAALFPDPSTTLEPRMLVINPGARISFRGNVTVNNDLIPFDYADGANGRTASFTNYEAPYMDTSSPNGIIPTLTTTNVYPTVSGTFAPGIAPYTNIIIDLYQLDPEGWANGKLFGLTELTDGVTYTNGFPQGKKYLGSFPVANTGSFSINAAGLDFGLGAVTVTVNYSADPAGTHNGRVHTSNFSNPAYAIPGGTDSVGITHIVNDVLAWWNVTGNYYTNGPILNPADEATNLANWEPNISVLGDSTFLIGANTFANDGAVANQNYVVTLQPAAGGPAKQVYEFYTDTNTPFKGQVNLSRQNGNPQRVGGDKRIGAVNYITAAEVSIGQLPEFQSDARWGNNPIYTDVNRYVASQPFSLNTTTLEATPLAKAWDYVYGPFVTANAPFTQPEVSRTGGTVAGLDNGNFVVVIHDKTAYTDPGANVTTFAIITPTGTFVKTNTLVDPRDIWDNVAAHKGGFVVRCHDTLYFYDNAGNLRGSSPQAISGISFDTGRGDGTRIASDIRSKYVYLAGRNPSTGNSPVMLAIWDADTMTFVTSAPVSDLDPTVHNVDRVNLAVDALDRICVAWDYRPTADFVTIQIAARVLEFDGTSVSYLTHSFFPFVNYDPTGISGLVTTRPSIAMTTKQICIAGKGTVNGTNNPTGSPTTTPETTLYTVINNPGAVAVPPTITASKSGSNLVISWPAADGSFTLQSSLTPAPAGFSNVVPQPPIVPAGSLNTMTVPIGSGNQFFRLSN